MRPHALPLLCAFLAFTSTLVAQAQEPMQVTAEQVRLRASPSTTAKVVAILGKGSTVKVLAHKGDWVEVRSGFTTGYVHASLLGPAQGTTPTTTATTPTAGQPAPASQGRTEPPAPQSAVAQPQTASHAVSQEAATAKPFSAYGGLGNASGGWGLGFGGGVGYAFHLSGVPVAIRVQGEFFHFQQSETTSGTTVSVSASDNIFGANAAAEYAFRTSKPSLVPYVIGGLGLYYSSAAVTVAAGGLGSTTGSAGTTSVAMAFGGGLRFGKSFFAELRVVPFFSGGTMVPIVVGMQF